MSLPDQITRFGDYELLRYLAAGGMADLYLARDPRFPGRELVVKRIQERYLDHKRVVKMFIDEGRIAKLLAHPNIVRVVDVGNYDGAWYIAMEYIHGHDLVAIGRRSVEAAMRIPRGVAVGIVLQAAAGLDYAHKRRDQLDRPLRIVHCDVSPGNVVIAFRGSAKIVDFGIARATIALREEEHVAGKYNYMAPEQIRGESVDARADLFSLGVILYELTLGRRLFRGRPEQVMRAVLDEPVPSPEDLDPDYPPSLARIVMRLLERDRELRYPSAGALGADLETFLASGDLGAGKSEIARYLRALFDAPRLSATDVTDPAVLIEDVEVDRGMPETGEVERLDSAALLDGDDGDFFAAQEQEPGPIAVQPPPLPLLHRATSQGLHGPHGDRSTLPRDELTLPVPQPPAAPWGRGDDRPTAAIDLPERARGRKRRSRGDDDGTSLVEVPDWRPPRRLLELSSGVVVGACMMVVALLLIIAYFTAGR